PVQFDDSGMAEAADEIGNNSYASRDVDLYQIQLAAGDSLKAIVQARDDVPPNSLDFGIALRIFNSSGIEQAMIGKDVGLQPGENIDFTAPTAGTYYVGVSYQGNTAYNPFVAGSGVAGLTGVYALTL